MVNCVKSDLFQKKYYSSNVHFRLVEYLIIIGDLGSHTHHEWPYVHLG